MARPAVEIVNELIPQIAKEQKLVDYVSEVSTVASGGANFASTMFTIVINEGARVLYLFAKVASAGDQLRLQNPKIYENEIFAYTKLVKTYQLLEKEQQVPHENRLALPQFYGYNSTVYEETIVLEDLLSSGYEPFNRFKSIDWEYAKAALSQLAQMHSLAFAYSEKFPEEYDQVLEDRMFKWDADGSMGFIFKTMLDKALEVTHEENKDKLKTYYDNFTMDSFLDFYVRCRRKVLGHGDFRPSNLMHKRLLDGTVQIKIVDLQTLQGTSPIIDLLYFLFMGSDEEFRTQHYDNTIEHYLKELHASMERLGLNPKYVYSKEDFDSELKEKLPFGLAIAVLGLPVITVAEENAPKVNKDLNINSFSVQKTSDLYAERMNEVVNDFVKWGILK